MSHAACVVLGKRVSKQSWEGRKDNSASGFVNVSFTSTCAICHARCYLEGARLENMRLRMV